MGIQVRGSIFVFKLGFGLGLGFLTVCSGIVLVWFVFKFF